MKVVGVAELKAKLSNYLARVKSGEEVVITDHGQPVARVVPLPPGEVPGRLASLAQRGLIRLPSSPAAPIRPVLPDPDGLLLSALLEEREASR